MLNFPRGRKTIRTKWIYDNKTEVDGNIIRAKARLVAKGYTQGLGEDFSEVFAAVLRHTKVRFRFKIAAKYKLCQKSTDIENTTINADLNEELYVMQPQRFVQPKHEQKFYKLRKALHRLGRSTRERNAPLNSFLINHGFKLSVADQIL